MSTQGVVHGATAPGLCPPIAAAVLSGRPRAPRTSHGTRRRIVGLLLVVAALRIAPASGDGPASPSPQVPPAPPAAKAPPATDPLVIGTFDVTVASVTDGDTIRVQGEPPVRVIGLDCEEVFKNAADRASAQADFAAYARAKRGASPRPVKFATPAGEAAKAFVQALFERVRRVRLERDEVGGHELDTFDRRLAHVVLLTDQGESQLAVEVVRAGHSPYFVKYGRSLRLDAALAKAQAEARAQKRGVWAESGPAHYDDYAERLAWWESRARQVDAWRAVPAAPDRIALGTLQAAERLAARVGQEATVFGTLRGLRTEAWPHLLWLTDRRGADVAVAVFEESAWSALDLDALGSRFVTVTGPVTLYRGRPQIEVRRPDQISTH